MSYDLLKPGTLVNFNTKASIFKTEYKAVMIEAVASADVAAMAGDVKALHLQIKPYIPGLPNL
uniref:phage DNA polymerase-associated SH3 family protein n=1 Tax=Staphylococcus aureus TaxID=1280 RepID=UPI00301E408E